VLLGIEETVRYSAEAYGGCEREAKTLVMLTRLPQDDSIPRIFSLKISERPRLATDEGAKAIADNLL
jgi:hypothetical protein